MPKDTALEIQRAIGDCVNEYEAQRATDDGVDQHSHSLDSNQISDTAEMHRVVDDCLTQYKREKRLLHWQRTELFRNLVAFLSEGVMMPEKYILAVHLHGVVQAIVDLAKNTETIRLLVSPWKG